MLALAPYSRADESLPISPAGEWLAKFLDRMDVEHHWLRGHEHVAWRTGLPLKKEHGEELTPLRRNETHCSAFAAAVAVNLGVNLLHPPEHSHVLLANAQYNWLAGDAGREAGWTSIESPLQAQQAANVGKLVVAAFKNDDQGEPGHIAVVRPSKTSARHIAEAGPQVTQAGFTNYRSIDLKTGFSHHAGAWPMDGEMSVKFYAHAIDAKKLAGE
jgi:hypothetical protein